MRKALAVAAVTALAILPAANASATKGPTLRSLQAQIKSLQKQVKALKKQTTLAQDIAVVVARLRRLLDGGRDRHVPGHLHGG